MTRPDAPPWRATYRLQISATFTFDDARDVVPYLADLGISHLYLSPILEAVRGSTHGYDGTDPTRVSAERGGEDALRALADEAHRHGLGVLVDIVPNHLAASDETPWWTDPDERAVVFDVDDDRGWYRRFFDIDGLAGVRQEDPAVFERTHAKVLELVRDGVADGLRIDHPDGLADPAGYLERLAEAAGVPIWIEKVLHTGERLRPWPVEGTVGYEVLGDLDHLWTAPEGEQPITAAYRELTGDLQSFEAVVSQAKQEQIRGAFRPELEHLAGLAPDIALVDLERAVTDLPCYRTYVRPGGIADEDRELVAGLRTSEPMRARLLLEEPGSEELVSRYQQLTPPVSAKGIEDTAFYRSTRLLAHNEVGGDPGTWARSPAAVHDAAEDRAAHHPRNLLAGTTHDTKRSADTRARLLALTHDASRFDEHVRRWFAVTDDLVTDAGPRPAERWYLFQTLLGAWPITFDRLEEHLTKALREAGRITDWVDPDPEREDAVIAFARRLLDHTGFWADFSPYAAEVAAAGERISIGQALLRATLPGVCDTYQGDESWFLSLVDPDVRRPLDWSGRRAQLDALVAGSAPTRATAKLFVLHRALDLRRRRPEPFAGDHRRLDAPDGTFAFVRGGEVAVAVALRPDTTTEVQLPPGRWRDVLGGVDHDLDLGAAVWERRADDDAPDPEEHP
ncbi:MAG TPA: alpha-amylase family glycosyl hydrolase [Acidimicrobiales bacterium]|nr:alpha-amylase family glycosyl hydrolase [Acidimicrobiales bacterium]